MLAYLLDGNRVWLCRLQNHCGRRESAYGERPVVSRWGKRYKEKIALYSNSKYTSPIETSSKYPSLACRAIGSPAFVRAAIFMMSIFAPPHANDERVNQCNVNRSVQNGNRLSSCERGSFRECNSVRRRHARTGRPIASPCCT